MLDTNKKPARESTDHICHLLTLHCRTCQPCRLGKHDSTRLSNPAQQAELVEPHHIEILIALTSCAKGKDAASEWDHQYACIAADYCFLEWCVNNIT